MPPLLLCYRYLASFEVVAQPLRQILMLLLSLQAELGLKSIAQNTSKRYLKHPALILPVTELMVAKDYLLAPIEPALKHHYQASQGDSEQQLWVLGYLLSVMQKNGDRAAMAPYIEQCKALIAQVGVSERSFAVLSGLSEPAIRLALIAQTQGQQQMLMQFYQADSELAVSRGLELANELLKGPYASKVLGAVFGLWFKQGRFEQIKNHIEQSCQSPMSQQAHYGYAVLSYNFHLLDCARHHYAALAKVKGRFNLELACHGPLSAFARLEQEFNETLEAFAGIAFFDSRQIAQLSSATPLLLVGKVDSLNNQFFYTFVLRQLCQRFKQLTMVCDSRVMATFSQSFPTVRFLPLDKFDSETLKQLPLSKRYLFNEAMLGEHQDKVICHIPFQRYFSDWSALERQRQQGPWLTPLPDRVAHWQQWLAAFDLPVIGLSVGSGKVDFERAMYMVEHRQLTALQRFDKLQIVSLDPHFDAQQLAQIGQECGLSIVTPEIDLFHQLDELLALLAALPLIVVTPNNLMDMGSALNTEVLVLDPTWQMKQWQAPDSPCYLLSNRTRFIRPSERNDDYLSDLNEQLYLALAAQLPAE